MENIKIYILTHKKFDYEKKNELYEPLLNGSALLNDDFGYTRDDTGDNISKLNPYYAELTGQYWAWKNSNVDIIGFCHYRRYFYKNLSMEKLDEEDVKTILESYDIILPQKKYLGKSNIESVGWNDFLVKLYGDTHKSIHTKEDYYTLRKIIEKKSPEYLNAYDIMLNNDTVYWFNMFICKKKIADDYFKWLFMILNEFKKQHDFSEYGDNKRILGYLSEKLLNVYVINHNLKIKEKYVLVDGLRVPITYIIANRFPKIQKFFNYMLFLEKKIR